MKRRSHGMLRLVRAQVFYGERKAWWIRVRARGNVGHGSRFVKGTAVEKLVRSHTSRHAGAAATTATTATWCALTLPCCALSQLRVANRVLEYRQQQEDMLTGSLSSGDGSSDGSSGGAHDKCRSRLKLGDVCTINLTRLKAGPDDNAFNVIPSTATAGATPSPHMHLVHRHTPSVCPTVLEQGSTAAYP